MPKAYIQQIHEAGGYICTTTARASNWAIYIAKIAAGRIKAIEQGIAKFLAKFIESGSVARKPGSGRPSKWNGSCNGTERAVEWNGPRNGT